MAFMTGTIARYRGAGESPSEPLPSFAFPEFACRQQGGGGKERVHWATCLRVGVASPAGEEGSDGEESQPHHGSDFRDPPGSAQVEGVALEPGLKQAPPGGESQNRRLPVMAFL